jgi:FMN phosphatase YigB (HAD superfamily)
LDVIGDSLNKDIKPALEIGAIGIWARYGKKCEPKNLETIRRITTLSEGKVEMEEDHKSINPSFIADSFSDLRKIIVNPPQIKLPGF